MAQLPAGTVVAMEACSGALHWARRCLEHGLQPKLITAQFVEPFRKSQAVKNDRNDAEAIATAAHQGNMRFVPVDGQVALGPRRATEVRRADPVALAQRLSTYAGLGDLRRSGYAPLVFSTTVSSGMPGSTPAAGPSLPAATATASAGTSTSRPPHHAHR